MTRPRKLGTLLYWTQGRSHVSKIGGVHLSFRSLQKSNYSGQRRRGRGTGGGVPLRSRLGSLGASRALPAGFGAEPQPQTILGRFVCNFMRFHATFRAFNSRLETGDFYTPLLASIGLIFPFNIFGCRTPQLKFLGCPDTHDTHSGCATDWTV